MSAVEIKAKPDPEEQIVAATGAPESPGAPGPMVRLPAPGPEQHPEDTSLLSWQFLLRLQGLRFKRFEWLVQNRNQLLNGWQVYRQEFGTWREEVNTHVQWLLTNGHRGKAREMVEMVLQDPNARDPGEFKLSMITGNNFETITFQSTPLDTINAVSRNPEAQQQLHVPERKAPAALQRHMRKRQDDAEDMVAARARARVRARAHTRGSASNRPSQTHWSKKEQTQISDLYETCEYVDWTLQEVRKEFKNRDMYLKLRCNRKTLIYALLRHDVENGVIDLDDED